jgi:hypothetical protein
VTLTRTNQNERKITTKFQIRFWLAVIHIMRVMLTPCEWFWHSGCDFGTLLVPKKRLTVLTSPNQNKIYSISELPEGIRQYGWKSNRHRRAPIILLTQKREICRLKKKICPGQQSLTDGKGTDSFSLKNKISSDKKNQENCKKKKIRNQYFILTS